MAAQAEGTLHEVVDALRHRFAAQGLTTERFDTHISTVLLAGDYAYKFKKPVNFGFLDFSTLARRRHFCEIELALNRRFAPSIYVDVLPVTAGPMLGGAGPAIEYALRMHRFATDDRLDRALADGRCHDADIGEIARTLAGLHVQAAAAPPLAHYGTPPVVRHQLLSGLEVLGDIAPDVQALMTQLDAAYASRVAAFEERLQTGHVRDCHGDLHLTNIVRHDGRWQAFDCIEFDDALRYIDTASDLAFLLMDLDVRGHLADANRLLSGYLDVNGDYAALSVLDFYLAYRSVVRAKVARLGADGSGDTQDLDARRRSRQHIDLALRYLTPRATPALYITHGVSGSGKSWVAARLARARGFIHLRSDIERKRLAGLAATASSHSGEGRGIYGAPQTAATYARLLHLAGLVLARGYTAIIDATFLHAAQRAPFEALARTLDIAYTIVDCDAPRAALDARIQARQAAGGDPSEATTAVLDEQLAQREALGTAERRHVIPAHTLDDEQALRRLPGGDRVVPG